jgi:hypothetical protein
LVNVPPRFRNIHRFVLYWMSWWPLS